MAEIILETERMILRTEADGDLDSYLKHLNTAQVQEHLGGVKEPHEVEAKLAKTAAHFAEHGFGFMAMQHKENGDLLGYCGLKTVDNPLAPMVGDFETGWLLRADYWRQGFAYEAVLAVLEFGFSRFDAPHIVALTSDRNAPSWRLMEKLGMTKRHDLEFDDPDYPPEDNPTIVYRIDRKQ